jgi:hypothetical protein
MVQRMDPLPGQVPPTLRPMRIGELLDAAIKLYRQHWKSVITIAAVIIVPVTALQSILLSTIPDLEPGEVPTPDQMGGLFSALSVVVLVQVLTTPLLTGGLSWLAAKFYLGENPTVQEAFAVAVSNFFSLLWVGILTFLASLVGVIFFIIPGIIIALRLTFSATAVVVEGVKGTRALGRSWRLSKGSLGKIFLTLVVSFILVGIFQAIVGIPISIIADAVGGPVGFVLSFLGDALASTIITPFAMIVIVLLYFDTRIRREGFDLTLMAQEIGPAT